MGAWAVLAGRGKAVAATMDRTVDAYTLQVGYSERELGPFRVRTRTYNSSLPGVLPVEAADFYAAEEKFRGAEEPLSFSPQRGEKIKSVPRGCSHLARLSELAGVGPIHQGYNRPTHPVAPQRNVLTDAPAHSKVTFGTGH